MNNLSQVETLSATLVTVREKCNELEVELSRAQNELDTQKNLKDNMEQMLTDKVRSLEVQVNEVSLQLYMVKYNIDI